MRPATNILQFRYSLDIVRSIEKALPRRRLYLLDRTAVSARENTSEEKLMYATSEAQDVLLKAKAVFPFMLFPDTIHLDREKLTIVHNSFIRSGNTISMQIGDILSVQANVGPLFGNLIISTKYFDNSTQVIKFLRRSDVVKFQRLIQGSLIAHRKQIDYSNIEIDQLVALLTDLGQSARS